MKNSMLFSLLFCGFPLFCQLKIGDFTSIAPIGQTTNFTIPTGFKFQKIIETNDPLTGGGTMSGNHDFTGYVPIGASSTNGYLSINQENTPGGVVVLDVTLNSDHLWEITSSSAVDFTSVGGTARNCSGTVTPWNTIISSEEITSGDGNMDGYNDLGWNVEIDPVTKTVMGKRWSMGNFNHENVVVHSNRRTVYQGSDSNPGYLFKFVADQAEDLSSGALYVYKGSKSGSGIWVPINNTTQTERNTTIAQCAGVMATSFNGIEDVEIGGDGLVYFAVKNESQIYRFQDSDPLVGTTVAMMETFVGNASYTITHASGSSLVAWGTGNDNLAFDSDNNLWVLQDGSQNYIWVVENGHTQANPKVKLFGSTPLGSEPTGITFSPDFKYLFMSIQHPNSTNNVTFQEDAAEQTVLFNKNISLVIARDEDLGLSATFPNGKVNVRKSDVYMKSIGSGVILRSPDGNCWKLTVDNSGIIYSAIVVCPD